MKLLASPASFSCWKKTHRLSPTTCERLPVSALSSGLGRRRQIFDETDRRDNFAAEVTNEKWSRADGIGKARSVQRKPGEDAMYLVRSGKALSGAGDNDPRFVPFLESASKS